MLALTGVYISSACANLVWSSISGRFQSVEFPNPLLSLNTHRPLVLSWGVHLALCSYCLQPLSNLLWCKQSCFLCAGLIFLCIRERGCWPSWSAWGCVCCDHMGAAARIILPGPAWPTLPASGWSARALPRRPPGDSRNQGDTSLDSTTNSLEWKNNNAKAN